MGIENVNFIELNVQTSGQADTVRQGLSIIKCDDDEPTLILIPVPVAGIISFRRLSTIL